MPLIVSYCFVNSPCLCGWEKGDVKRGGREDDGGGGGEGKGGE